MVTHDVDEALLLSDRIVLLTNGPESYIGQILDIPSRPRDRMEVVKHPTTACGVRLFIFNQQKRAKSKRPSKL